MREYTPFPFIFVYNFANDFGLGLPGILAREGVIQEEVDQTVTMCGDIPSVMTSWK